MTLPERFRQRVSRDLGITEGEALLSALDAAPEAAVRFHPRKVADVPALERRLEASGRVPWCAWGRYLARRPTFTLDAAFHAGAYYVQEPSSQAVGLLAGDLKGCRILDLCAAPGGKTTLYASLAGPEGLVVANEVDRRRAQALTDNVRKWGTANVAVTSCEARALGDLEAWFDVVAVDAPCSGEGMFRKDAASRGEWSEAAVALCAARQDAILKQAWRALRPGGLLLYSTCTFNRDENEGTLERLAAWAGDALVEADAPAFDPSWGVLKGCAGAFRTFRFYPHRARGEGFFAAVARKAEGAARARLPRLRRPVIGPLDRAAAVEAARWTAHPDAMRFGAVAGGVYAWPEAQADAVKALSEAVPVIYSGVAMGQLYGGRLKPDPAMAWFTGLAADALPAACVEGDEALRYLRREEVAAERFAEGVNLVVADGWRVGFAKRIGARVNNLYPQALRIRMQSDVNFI